MRLASYQMSFSCQFMCTIFIHQEELETSLVFFQRLSLVLWRETDMAGERSENLEELVRRIVHSVNRNETSHSNDNGSTSNSVQNRASTVKEELNQRLLIPWGAPSNDSTRAQDIAAQFNPNNNYGYTNYRSRQPSRQRNTPYGFSRQRTSTSRPSYSRRGTRERPAEVSTLKEVILLPHPTTTKVPKFHHKLRLQQCGLISDDCAIERAWNESEVRRFLSSLFFEKLKAKHGEPVNFEFVKVIGSEVTPVNISTGQEMNAKVLLGIAKQRPVYIRAMRSLPVCTVLLSFLCYVVPGNPKFPHRRFYGLSLPPILKNRDVVIFFIEMKML